MCVHILTANKQNKKQIVFVINVIISGLLDIFIVERACCEIDIAIACNGVVFCLCVRTCTCVRIGLLGPLLHNGWTEYNKKK